MYLSSTLRKWRQNFKKGVPEFKKLKQPIWREREIWKCEKQNNLSNLHSVALPTVARVTLRKLTIFFTNIFFQTYGSAALFPCLNYYIISTNKFPFFIQAPSLYRDFRTLWLGICELQLGEIWNLNFFFEIRYFAK